MTSSEYRNTVYWTLQAHTPANETDLLNTARRIFNNLGVPFPQGTLADAIRILSSGDYMGWSSCDAGLAQGCANNGFTAIGINEHEIVIILPEESTVHVQSVVPVTAHPIVKTLADVDPESVNAMQFFTFATLIMNDELSNEQDSGNVMMMSPRSTSSSTTNNPITTVIPCSNGEGGCGSCETACDACEFCDTSCDSCETCDTYCNTCDSCNTSCNSSEYYNRYIVVYDGNGGTVAVDYSTAYINTPITLPNATRNNYDFIGWYTAPIGGMRIGGAGDSYTGTMDITVYAHWVSQYIITYNDNYTGSTNITKNVTPGECTSLPYRSRDGYDCIGWYTAPSGGVKIGNEGDCFTPSSSMTLYARWVIVYNVTFDYNGGSGSPALRVVHSGTSISLPSASRDGYEFLGWYTAAKGGTKIGVAGDSFTVTCNITLVAQWLELTAEVILDRFANHIYLSDQTVKKATMLTIGRVLANAGFHPTFIIGMLGHIYGEGNVGMFEKIHSTWYFNAMKDHDFADGETYYSHYENNYSNQYIYNGKKLSDVKNLVEELLKLKYVNTDNEELSLRFGLGCIQWTSDRTLSLINTYMGITNNNTITLEQVYQAEAQMITNELTGSYSNLYTHWQTQCSNPFSADAAYWAGYYAVIGYGLNPYYLTHELPDKYRSWYDIADQRGQNARYIYNILIN